MIKLDTTTRKLQAVLGGAITTNQLPCTVCYSDDNGTTYVGGTQLTNTNSTTAVDICAAPAASTVRDIDYLSIKNNDTATATVTVMLDDNGTDYEIVKATLAAGDQLVYTHSNGWNALDSAGQVKSSATGGGVSDGDKGDITVSSSGTVWTIDNDAVTYAKIQNVSATDKVLGRSTAGAGDVEEIACTAFARSILDDADEATFKATVNLEIGTDVQAYDADLSAIAALAKTDGNIIVGDGLTWVAESGATARTSLGLGTGDSPQFTGIELGHASDTTLTRVSAGVVAIEGTNIVKAGAATSSGLTMATSRVLGRTTAATGAIEELTLSNVLDLIGSAAQGDILYRDAASWARLGAGTSGHFLKTQGAGANPTWAAASGSGGITLGTAQASTSGTAIDFTSIPSGTNLIIVSFIGVSTNGTSGIIVQLGDSGGVETSGYLGCAYRNAYTNYTDGIGISSANAAASVYHGLVILNRADGNTWCAGVFMGQSDTNYIGVGGASKTLSAELDRIRVTTSGGVNTFDAGTLNLSYMGS